MVTWRAAKAGTEDQPVEAVALDAPGPHGDQRRLETRPDLGSSRDRGGGPGDLEFMYPDDAAVGAVDAEGLFGDHAQPEIFEHRQHIGEGDGLFRPIEPQPRPPVFGDRMKRNLQSRAFQRILDPRQVGDRLGGLGQGLVGDWKRLEAAQPDLRLGLAEFRLGRLLQPVRPASPGLGQLLFQRRHVDCRHGAPGGVDDELDARQHRFVEMGVKCREPASEGLFEDRREAPAQIAVVALARHIDEAGHKALERVAAHEQRDALPLLQIEDADDRLE